MLVKSISCLVQLISLVDSSIRRTNQKLFYQTTPRFCLSCENQRHILGCNDLSFYLCSYKQELAEHGNSGKNYEARKCGLTSAREREKKKNTNGKPFEGWESQRETSGNNKKRGGERKLATHPKSWWLSSRWGLWRPNKQREEWSSKALWQAASN